jgi:hypothetical protein
VMVKGLSVTAHWAKRDGARGACAHHANAASPRRWESRGAHALCRRCLHEHMAPGRTRSAPRRSLQ